MRARFWPTASLTFGAATTTPTFALATSGRTLTLPSPTTVIVRIVSFCDGVSDAGPAQTGPTPPESAATMKMPATRISVL